MKIEEISQALHRLKVETGSLACLGCGHEHNCSTHGCAIIRAAADIIVDGSGGADRVAGRVWELVKRL